MKLYFSRCRIGGQTTIFVISCCKRSVSIQIPAIEKPLPDVEFIVNTAISIIDMGTTFVLLFNYEHRCLNQEYQIR